MLVPLPLIEKSCGIDIEELTPEILSARISFGNMLYYTRMCRRLGVAQFLMTGRSGDLMDALFNGSNAFAYFLRLKNSNSPIVLSRCEVVFDAIACGDDDSLHAIKQFSPDHFLPDYEYEEDFLYLKLLLLMAAPAPTANATELTQIMERAEAVQSKDGELKIALCRLILEKNAVAFQEGLQAYMQNIDRNIASSLEKGEIDSDHAATTAWISIEGVALKRVAELRGIPVLQEISLIPSMIGTGRWTPPPRDAWKHPQSYFDLWHSQ